MKSTIIAVLVITGMFGSWSAAGPWLSGQDPNPGASTARQEPTRYINPKIQGFGRVVHLPEAAHQPRNRSKIVVDITRGGEADQLNPAVEKVCRFVNIYAGAGKDPASVDIAVVLHGDATLVALNAEAYSARFDTDGNPTLACLQQLHDAGVKVYVCGQSLVGKNAKTSEANEYVDVSVSALSALVNFQADGYSYLPML